MQNSFAVISYLGIKRGQVDLPFPWNATIVTVSTYMVSSSRRVCTFVSQAYRQDMITTRKSLRNLLARLKIISIK